MRLADQLSQALTNVLIEDAGASLAEYALLGALVLVVCLLLVLALVKGT
jgi:hypothetical protein